MKNLSLVLNTVMGIAIIILFYLQLSSKAVTPAEQQIEEVPTTEAIEEMIVSSDSSKSKIGYINVDSLQIKYKLYDELKSKLEKKEKSYEAQFKAKTLAFQKKYEDIRKRSQNMTEFELQLNQKELAEEDEKLYQMREEFAQRLEKEMIELNVQLYKTIKEYIKQHNELTKYDIIIGESQTRNFVLDFNKDIDITNDIVKGLNKKYNEDKAPKVKP
ncbi:MAG: OmpH family outer membrane protein [Flavobacteriales bacterium]|nr:OmpH family outer membrane protein [Flavobacteriales bacterium]MCW8913340.1 OmpH family outer membrane protein [Flavobacteriales bacterium]MCW8936926.1 OmpH family outer membrane protein [Flavobacteriales bacterium]MCW8939339.1 OmpH family outer membrane protein [Flavobacteriales bacterium]MCW8968613.1 OmpH family outer membrane protein [Flavobacteriales bacterium]